MDVKELCAGCIDKDSIIFGRSARVHELEQQLSTTKAELEAVAETNSIAAFHLAEKEAELIEVKQEGNRYLAGWEKVHAELQAERAQANTLKHDAVEKAEIERDAILKALEVCKIYNPEGLDQVNLGALKGYAMSIVDNALIEQKEPY